MRVLVNLPTRKESRGDSILFRHSTVEVDVIKLVRIPSNVESPEYYFQAMCESDDIHPEARLDRSRPWLAHINRFLNSTWSPPKEGWVNDVWVPAP